MQKDGYACLQIGFKNPETGIVPDLHTQRVVLQGLVVHIYKQLSLSDSAALEDTILEKFLKKSSETLEFLNLNNCNLITDGCLPLIRDCCLI